MGDLSDRVKTDMRLPRVVVQHVEAMAESVGLTKNGFFTVAAAMMAAGMSRDYALGRKRRTMLLQLEKEVQKVFNDAKKSV